MCLSLSNSTTMSAALPRAVWGGGTLRESVQGQQLAAGLTEIAHLVHHFIHHFDQRFDSPAPGHEFRHDALPARMLTSEKNGVGTHHRPISLCSSLKIAGVR